MDCLQIGTSIADFVGLGSASTYDGPCHAAMLTATEHIEGTLLNMDQLRNVSIFLNGFAKRDDSDANGQVDGLVDGNFTMGGSEQVLAEEASPFSATRPR